MNQILAWYAANWAWAAAHINEGSGQLMAVAMVVLLVAVVLVVRQTAWLLVDGLTGGELADREVQRKKQRWGT